MSSDKESSPHLSGGNSENDEDIAFVSPERPNHHTEPGDFVYKVLSVDQLLVLQADIIDEVNNVLNLSPQVTRTILNHFKWKKDQLNENYFESDPQEFFQRVRALNPFKQESPSPSPPEACEVCYCSDQKLKGLGCGHSYCAACWKQYLAVKTCSEGLSHTINCPAPKCDILVDYPSFLALADDSKVVERYKQLITNNFVRCNTLMRWCPAPNCSHAIEANYMEPKAVKCKCGHQFCFGCGENWHEPVGCSWLEKWLKINAEDLESSEWLEHNTKRCPQCKLAIEKDGGCEHMVCRNPSCQHSFCWLCMRPWKQHESSSFKCSLFWNKESERVRLAKQISRDTNARYQLYRDRYIKQKQTMKMEHKLYAKVQAKMDDMLAEISRIEMQFLRDAVEALCQCRLILMYSYVFAFYLKNNNQKVIFEYNQSDLEMATKKLSEYLEREITSKNLYDIKQKVIELSQYCQQRRHILLTHVREGNEKDHWDFIEETA